MRIEEEASASTKLNGEEELWKSILGARSVEISVTGRRRRMALWHRRGDNGLVSDESGRDEWRTDMGRRRHQELLWQEMSRKFEATPMTFE